MKRVVLFLIILTIALTIGCYDTWYPVYNDWLSTINIDGTDLNYVRDSYGSFLLSPDRETLIEYSSNKFWSVDPSNLYNRTLLHDFGDDSDAIFYPTLSNSLIAFTHHMEIYTYNLESSDTTRLTFTEDMVLNWYPALSSDGTKIAFATINDSLSSIVIMNYNGTEQDVIYEVENIVYDRKHIKSIRFVSQDQVLLYVISNSPDSTVDRGVYSIRTDGTDNHCIVEDVYPWYLTLSPNKDYIIFADGGYIHKVNVDGTNHILLGSAGDDFFDPSISPDGEKILFTYGDYPYIMNADGSDRYQVTNLHIGSFYHDLKESFFINNYKLLLNLEKQIN